MERIFISSVQKELAAERRALRDFIQGDALLRRFFEVFLFEDLPATDRRTDQVYLDEVDRCDLYVGLFANEYGYENPDGLSPTEREFDRATVTGKTRLIFVKGTDDNARHRKTQALICEVLFLARYIEKFGTGTLMMIRESLAHALPEPDFVQRAGELVTTVWRDWLTEKVVNALGLNARQRQACVVVKTTGRITNAIYQQMSGASRPTAIRDLAELVAKGVFIRHGAARSAFYTIAENRLKNDSNDSRERSRANESEMTQKRPNCLAPKTAHKRIMLSGRNPARAYLPDSAGSRHEPPPPPPSAPSR